MDSNTLQNAFWSVIGDLSDTRVELLKSELKVSFDDIVPLIADRLANSDTTTGTSFEDLLNTIDDVLMENDFFSECDDGWFVVELGEAARNVSSPIADE